MSSSRGVGVDVVGHLDAAEAVADVAVHAEDAAHVHGAFDRRRDPAQLDLAVLGDRGDAGGQAAGQADEHVLDRRRAVVLGGEDLGMVDVERVPGAVALLLAEAEEALDVGVAVRAVLPLARGSPLELARPRAPRSSASRAPSSASTLTPLLTGVSVAVIGQPPLVRVSPTRRSLGVRSPCEFTPAREPLSKVLLDDRFGDGLASRFGDRAADGHLAPDLGIERLAELGVGLHAERVEHLGEERPRRRPRARRRRSRVARDRGRAARCTSAAVIDDASPATWVAKSITARSVASRSAPLGSAATARIVGSSPQSSRRNLQWAAMQYVER